MSKVSYRFSHGTLLLDDGSPDTPGIVQEYTSSNGTTIYTAIRWRSSQKCSCNCPGWAFKRECKHSRKVAYATVSKYSGRDPRLIEGISTLGAGKRQARTLKFNGNDS
jgi:hypothetical protein